MNLETMSVSRVVDFALAVLLEQGFKSDHYSKAENWKEGIEYAYGLDWEEEGYESYNLSEISEVWGLIFQEGYVDTSKPYTKDDITVEVTATEYDSRLTDREAHFVVFKMTQGDITRHIMQKGWYSSYGESSLSEGETLEVKPQTATVVEWASC